MPHLPVQPPHLNILDTQFIRCLAQDVVLADLEDCDERGGLDKAEHPAVSVEDGPERTGVVVAGALELGDPEMAEGVSDNRTEGGEGGCQGNVGGDLGTPFPALLRIPGQQPAEPGVLLGPGGGSRLEIASDDARQGAVAAVSPDLVGLRAAQYREVSPDRSVGRLAKGMHEGDEEESAARVEVLGIGLRSGARSE